MKELVRILQCYCDSLMTDEERDRDCVSGAWAESRAKLITEGKMTVEQAEAEFAEAWS